MSELCTDNRFELIEKYKAKLIEATNIECDTLDMAAIDSILFRFWQMGWLDKLETAEVFTQDFGITIPPHPVMGEWKDDESHPFADDVMMGERKDK